MSKTRARCQALCLQPRNGRARPWVLLSEEGKLHGPLFPSEMLFPFPRPAPAAVAGLQSKASGSSECSSFGLRSKSHRSPTPVTLGMHLLTQTQF